MAKAPLPKEILLGDIGHQFLLTWLMCNGYFHALPVWNVCSHPPQLSTTLFSGWIENDISLIPKSLLPRVTRKMFSPSYSVSLCWCSQMKDLFSEGQKLLTSRNKYWKYRKKYWKQTSRNKHIKTFCSATLCNILGMFNQGEDMIIPG